MTALPHADAPALPAREGLARGNLAAAASMTVWAAGFPAAGALLATWDPMALVAGRFAMALLLLGPLLLLVEGWPRGVAWGRALLAGGIGIGGGGIFLIFALAVTDPVTAAVFASVSPLTGTLVEWARTRRRLSGAFLWGLAASVVGGVIATAGSEIGGGGLLLGAALSVLSCLAYSWGSDESVRLLPGRSALAQGTVSVAGGTIATTLAFGLSLALGGAGLPEGGAGLRDLGLLAVYGMGGMALSQVLFVLAVRHVGVALASFHINIAPFYVMLILLALGGEWSWAQATGAAVVAVGVLLAQR